MTQRLILSTGLLHRSVVVIPYNSIAFFFNQLVERRMSYAYCRQIPRRHTMSDTRRLNALMLFELEVLGEKYSYVRSA
jgi:hypothetical protein